MVAATTSKRHPNRTPLSSTRTASTSLSALVLSYRIMKFMLIAPTLTRTTARHRLCGTEDRWREYAYHQLEAVAQGKSIAAQATFCNSLLTRALICLSMQVERRKLKASQDTSDETKQPETAGVGPNYALAAKWYHTAA